MKTKAAVAKKLASKKRAPKHPSNRDLMRMAVYWWRRHRGKAYFKKLPKGHAEEACWYYLTHQARPSVNVSEVALLRDPKDGRRSIRYVVLKDHAGGSALPAYPVLAVLRWTGKKLVNEPNLHPNSTMDFMADMSEAELAVEYPKRRAA